MRCIRCQSDSAEGTRFCALCGFPIALDDFVTCAVCGGEVHADVKICPGCHHSFAAPVPLSCDAPAPKRSLLFPVATAGLALAIFAYLHTTISSAPEVVKAPQPPVAVEGASRPDLAAIPVKLEVQSSDSAVTVASFTQDAASSRTPDRPKEHVIYLDIGNLSETPKKAPAKATTAKVKKPKARAIEKQTAAPAVVQKTVAPAAPAFAEAPQEEPGTPLLVSAENAQAQDDTQRFHRCRGQWLFTPDCPRP